jgi:hypothetical protein
MPATWPLREYLEGTATLGLLSIVTPLTLAKVIVQPDRAGAMPGMTAEKAAWLRGIMGANGRKEMRAAAKGLLNFDSRPWLKDLLVPTFDRRSGRCSGALAPLRGSYVWDTRSAGNSGSGRRTHFALDAHREAG